MLSLVFLSFSFYIRFTFSCVIGNTPTCPIFCITYHCGDPALLSFYQYYQVLCSEETLSGGEIGFDDH